MKLIKLEYTGDSFYLSGEINDFNKHQALIEKITNYLRSCNAFEQLKRKKMVSSIIALFSSLVKKAVLLNNTLNNSEDNSDHKIWYLENLVSILNTLNKILISMEKHIEQELKNQEQYTKNVYNSNINKLKALITGCDNLKKLHGSCPIPNNDILNGKPYMSSVTNTCIIQSSSTINRESINQIKEKSPQKKFCPC